MTTSPSGRRIPPGIHGFELESVETDAGGLWFPISDLVMRDHLRNAGTWEPEIGRALCELFPATGGVFVDIGANVGYFSALIASRFPGAEIHAFEPHPMTHSLLELNTWRFGDRITTYPCALADTRGTVALLTSQNNLGDTKGLAASDHLCASTVAPSMRLDDILGGTHVDVVKIDVQGAEFAVLAGMGGIIERARAIHIVMEFSPDLLLADHTQPQAMLATLRERGFTIYLLRAEGPVEASDREILAFCESAGPFGQANLLLSSRK